MARETTFSVRAVQGGRLLNVRSPENVGVGNYIAKVNWRRLEDAEVPREGHLPFQPMAEPPETPPAQPGIGTILGQWEAVRPNGDRAIVIASATTIARFDAAEGEWVLIGENFSAQTTFWQGESLDGYLILNNGINLPVTYRVEESAVQPIREMRENGIACVGHITVANGFLICSDITEVQASHLATVMNSVTPYGVVDASLTNRIRYKIAWGDFGTPRNWAPVVSGSITSSYKNKVTLTYPMPYTFPVGAKLAVIGAGPNGTTLGGQSGLDDGVAVTAVNGAVLTLSASADSALTFPLTVQVTRFADVSTFAGSSTIKDDSSAIVAVRPLKQLVVVYRETGVWVGRYTGDVTTPFQFRPAYKGPNVCAHPRAIADIEGDYHIFAGARNFYRFDGAGNPVIHETTDEASQLFFAAATTAPHKVFASHNGLTREWWFHHEGGVLAFDYVKDSAATIDFEYGAATAAYKPGATERWMLLASGGNVLRYGATETQPLTYLRSDGTEGEDEEPAPVVCTLRRGDLSLNDDENEKDLSSYMPLFQRLPDTGSTLTVRLFGRDNIARTPDLLCAVPIDAAASQPLVETFYRNIYFFDEVEFVPGATQEQTKFTGSTFSFSRVGSRGVTRNNHGAV